jgi:hypothetical protein
MSPALAWACAMPNAVRRDGSHPRFAGPSACAGAAGSGSPFLRSTFENCEREMVTPSRRSISWANRASVQFVRSATGPAKSGPATLSAACAFTGNGPHATFVRTASMPPAWKSERHSRTVSSRTPNASAIRALVQPDNVSKTVRARSASARSAPLAIAFSAICCSSVADN